MDGPNLPEIMENPCIVEAAKFEVLFVIGMTPLNNVSSYFYHTRKNTWTDATNNEVCNNNRVSMRYSCSKLHSNAIIVSFIYKGGAICTLYFDLDTQKWGKIGLISGGDDFANAKMLMSRDKQFVTLLAHSMNKTYIYQVSTANITFHGNEQNVQIFIPKNIIK